MNSPLPPSLCLACIITAGLSGILAAVAALFN